MYSSKVQIFWQLLICLVLFDGFSQVFGYKKMRYVRKMEEHEPDERQFLFTAIIKDSEDIERCNGALISEQHVLITAKCAESFDDVNEIRVVLGSPSVITEVISVITHAEYDPDEGENNIAILQLSDMFNAWGAALPACLARPAYIISNPLFYVSGVSITSNMAVNVLKMVTIPTKNCERFLDETITDGKFCANAFENICPAEDGTPLVKMEQNIPTLVGLALDVSCDSQKPVVFTRVAFYAEWIAQNTIGSLLC